ncbi:MAG TPA: MarR family transcriptional regulator [Mycobacteriales bacterium]|nr:MarR family transcriptional regulator [Mycobacteriales bacterium]
MPRRNDDSDTDSDELATAWHDLMGRYHRITCTLDRELQARHGLSGSEFEVLQQLDAARHGDGTVRMHELGERVHLTQSALSRMIGRLERDGLAERAMCTDDRRSVWAKITPAGAKLYAEAKPTQRAILREQAVGCIEQSEAAFADR